MKPEKDQRWSRAIMVRYALFQLPGLAVVVVILLFLHHWEVLETWILWTFGIVWVAKDVLFYPFVWQAYHWKRAEDENPMIGARATARDRLDPSGHVDVRGEIWRAEVSRGGRPVEKGEAVRIQALHGLILLVTPEEEGEGGDDEATGGGG
jgi:membrane-bound ClpP family serine protease